MEIETSEQLAIYVDTLKTLFSHARREHNEPVVQFLRRFMDGLIPRDAMLPLVQDDSTRRTPATAAEKRLEQVATALTPPVAQQPPDYRGDGGIKVELPDNPPPRSPSPAAAKPVW